MGVRILVVNVNWLGDVIFSTPVFSSLKRAFPDSYLACLAVLRVKPILRHISTIDEIIDCPDHFSLSRIVEHMRVAAYLRKKRFDKVFFLHRSSSRRWMTVLAGIPERIGYANPKRSGGLTVSIQPPDIQKIHRSDYYLNLLETTGIPVADRICCLSIPSDVEAGYRAKWLSLGVDVTQPYAVIHPGANWELKRWPVDCYARLVESMTEVFKIPIVFSGGPQDHDLHKNILNRIQGGVIKPVSLVGKLSLDETIGFLKTARVLVSADSGPLHIANSLGTPTVAIFGPTRPELTGPRGPGTSVILQQDTGCNRQACYHTACPDNICMKAVNVKDVMCALEKVLSS